MVKIIEDINIEDYTLIIPSVAVGNVGQLCTDLLIFNLGLRRIGYIFSPVLIPVIGLDPYNENSQSICTTLDIYVGIEKKIVVIQIRSPLVIKSTQLLNELLKFVIDNKLKKVILLTSSYGHTKLDSHIRTTGLRYVASKEILVNYKTLFDDLQWMEHKMSDENKETLVIPGGGFATKLFDGLAKAHIPCAILLKFCCEGDNIPDALDLLHYLNSWFGLLGAVNVKYPPSWKHLFGNGQSIGLY